MRHSSPHPGIRLVGSALLFFALVSVSAAETRSYRPTVAEASSAALWGSPEAAAPVFIVHGAEAPHNRIGTPRATDRAIGTRISVDPDVPRLFMAFRPDQIGPRLVEHAITRVHFEKIPFRFSTHLFEAHRNPGVIAIETTDAETGEPLFLTLVHTCGCYRVTLPTTNVPDAWLPEPYPETLSVHGIEFPSRLAPPALGEHWQLELMADRHRFTAISTGPVPDDAVAAEIGLLEDLYSLPVALAEPARTASFYYGSGPLRGHVRGAWNLFEGLTLGFVALDPTVGMDKDFGPPEQTGTPFYTMLPIWKQDASRLDRFEPLLRELGFRIPPRIP